MLLSFGLIATWTYHFYDKSRYGNSKPETFERDSTEVVNVVRDSLQKIYFATISNLDLKLDSSHNTSDSLQAQLLIKENEARRLRTEIGNILKNPKPTSSELLQVRQKLKELEAIVSDLRNQKSTLEEEKKDLNDRLSQMSGEVDNLQQSIRRLNDENKNLSEKIKLASVFVASSLHFAAMNIRPDKEQETSLARKADKFVVSFVLQNNFNEYMNAEIFIVITEPDGHILQNSIWESGSFDTKTDGKRNYTRKMRFDYTKGEQKALIFSLTTETFQKGTYTLQIWHSGTMIGEIAKTLN